jgi:hypothetical protein
MAVHRTCTIGSGEPNSRGTRAKIRPDEPAKTAAPISNSRIPTPNFQSALPLVTGFWELGVDWRICAAGIIGAAVA